MLAEGSLAPQAKVGVNARRGLSEEDERDIAKPLTTRRGSVVHLPCTLNLYSESAKK